MFQKIKKSLNKLKFKNKNPNQRDIIREELLKDFDFECKDS